MTRARILADYVSSGDELALKAPIAGPTFTGTVAIPNVANLETAVVANTAKVTGSTSASDLASGTLATARMAAGTVVFTDNTTLVGTTLTSTTEAWLTTGNTITVTAANAALGSKISISFTHAFEVRQGTTEARIDYRLQRLAVTDTTASTIESNLYATGHRGTTNESYETNISGTVLDTSLGTGNHTYDLQFRKAGGSTAQSGAIGYNWYSGAIHNMMVMVIK